MGESELDDPLAELESFVEDGRAKVVLKDLSWGEQVSIDFAGGSGLTLSREQHEMKMALVDDCNDAIIEMVDSHEEEWEDVLDEHDVEDEDRRRQLRKFADSAIDER